MVVGIFEDYVEGGRKSIGALVKDDPPKKPGKRKSARPK